MSTGAIFEQAKIGPKVRNIIAMGVAHSKEVYPNIGLLARAPNKVYGVFLLCIKNMNQ
jgi:hypothetical protein